MIESRIERKLNKWELRRLVELKKLTDESIDVSYNPLDVYCSPFVKLGLSWNRSFNLKKIKFCKTAHALLAES